MFKRLKNNFFTGFLVILPLLLTVAIFTFLVDKINENFLSPMIKLLPLDFSNPLLLAAIKTLGFLITIFLIALIGLATRLILLRNLFGFWEKLLLRVPMVGKIYFTIKEISSAFLGQEKHAFEQVVLIEFPRKGIYTLAFITAQGSQEIREKAKADLVHVFLPTSPNPTTGFFLAIPKNEVIPLEMSVADGLKMIVSGGVFRPPIQKTEDRKQKTENRKI